MKLWHCPDTRSLRPLWALEEMGLHYELEIMPFPPRQLSAGYKDLNILGTVPYFTDGAVRMTESTGICLYLVEKYGHGLGLRNDHAEYGDYLNWLFYSDATLTFPLSIVRRYTEFESAERQNPQAVADYKQWFFSRLRMVNQHIEHREYLCDGRFTIADIAVGFGLHLGEMIGLSTHYKPHVQAYLERLKARPAFIRAQAIGK